MFELLYFNQFSSFIVQLRSVNCFLQNKWKSAQERRKHCAPAAAPPP